LKCLIVCPEEVFVQWKDAAQAIKADPVDEAACLECLACELICPVDAIYITQPPSQTDTLSALLDES
jgi:NAD-dependent dihydropyrimidine dehydrogenase PreA subunit